VVHTNFKPRILVSTDYENELENTVNPKQ